MTAAGLRHVVVHGAAPIPHGDEIAVRVLRLVLKKEVEAVVVSHLASSVVYGPSGVFDDQPTHPVVGAAALYLAPRPSRRWEVVEQFAGLVRECVVSNCSIDTGNGDSYVGAVTSFLVEPKAAATPYR